MTFPRHGYVRSRPSPFPSAWPAGAELHPAPLKGPDHSPTPYMAGLRLGFLPCHRAGPLPLPPAGLDQGWVMPSPCHGCWLGPDQAPFFCTARSGLGCPLPLSTQPDRAPMHRPQALDWDHWPDPTHEGTSHWPSGQPVK